MPVQETNIVWTDYSANHWVGCAKTSEGCRYCWSENMALSFKRTPKEWTIANIEDNLEVYDENITELLSQKQPGWCFFPSSSDPFLPWLPNDAVWEFFDAIEQNPQHCFQVLTKWGPELQLQMQDVSTQDIDHYSPHSMGHIWPENVILGVTVESPRRSYRIDWLREQDAHTKFISFEPLIEEIPCVDLAGIDWAIVGGETHQDSDLRRDMNPEWACRILEECREQDVAFLFKQHSDRYPEMNRKLSVGFKEVEFNEFPDTPSGVPDAPMQFLE